MRLSMLPFVPILASGMLFAQQAPEARVEQKFVSGGAIRLHLQAGGYTVTPGDSDKIVVVCHARSDRQLKDVKVAIRPAGNKADVYVQDTPHNNFTVTIEIPRRSDLWVRLTAGELDVGTVEGNKDLEMNAGSLRVDIARPEDYGQREASVTSGSIASSAFDVNTGGLFRSFSQHGPGRYRLHAHLIAGEIVLRGGI